jgi:hypothetical protein
VKSYPSCFAEAGKSPATLAAQCVVLAAEAGRSIGAECLASHSGPAKFDVLNEI